MNRALFFLLIAVVVIANSCGGLTSLRGASEGQKVQEDDRGKLEWQVNYGALTPDRVRISGQLNDHETAEPLIFATLVVYLGEQLVSGTQTDIDGNFVLELDYTARMEEGELNLCFHYLGYTSLILSEMALRPGAQLLVQGNMALENIIIGPPILRDYWPPLIRVDETGSGQTFTSEQVRRSPTRG